MNTPPNIDEITAAIEETKAFVELTTHLRDCPKTPEAFQRIFCDPAKAAQHARALMSCVMAGEAMMRKFEREVGPEGISEARREHMELLAALADAHEKAGTFDA